MSFPPTQSTPRCQAQLPFPPASQTPHQKRPPAEDINRSSKQSRVESYNGRHNIHFNGVEYIPSQTPPSRPQLVRLLYSILICVISSGFMLIEHRLYWERKGQMLGMLSGASQVQLVKLFQISIIPVLINTLFHESLQIRALQV